MKWFFHLVQTNKISLFVALLALWAVVACSGDAAIDSSEPPATDLRQPITQAEEQAAKIEETPAGHSEVTPLTEQN